MADQERSSLVSRAHNTAALEAAGWLTRPPRAFTPYLNGRCFDFALALHAYVPEAEFVVLGSRGFPDHVGLRLPDGRLLDVRGITPDPAAFASGIRPPAPGQSVPEPVPVDREEVALHCGLAGVPPPYRGCPDIESARRDARARFPGLKAPRQRAMPPDRARDLSLPPGDAQAAPGRKP